MSGINTLFISKGGINLLRDDVCFYLKTIESTAHRLNQEFEKTRDNSWWQRPNLKLLRDCDLEMNGLISLSEKGSRAIGRALRVAENINGESIIARVFHRIAWGKSE